MLSPSSEGQSCGRWESISCPLHVHALINLFLQQAASACAYKQKLWPQSQGIDALLLVMQFVQTLTHLVDSGACDPKMNALETTVVRHFQGQAPNNAAMGVLAPTSNPPGSAKEHPGRVIIFTNFRESVNSILDMFQKHEPLVSARLVIGPTCSRGCPGPRRTDSSS